MYLPRRFWIVGCLALLGTSTLVFVAGCTHDASKADTQTKAATPSADKALIEAQGSCPISKDKLGSMGEPIKVMVNGQPVFLCCESCKKKALANPEKTLAAVEELKQKNKQ